MHSLRFALVPAHEEMKLDDLLILSTVAILSEVTASAQLCARTEAIWAMLLEIDDLIVARCDLLV